MIEKCLQDPPLEAIVDQHLSRCWRAREIAAGTLDPVPPPAGPEGHALRNDKPVAQS
jgi:hypothetical protein